MMSSMLKKILDAMAGSATGNHFSDIEDSGRRRLFVIFLLLLICPLLVGGAQLIARGLFLLAVVNGVVVVSLAVFIALMSKLKNARILYRIVLAMLAVLVLYWVNRGAIQGYASIWILTLPPFAFYLLGRQEGLFWTLTIALLTAIQFVFPALSFYGFVYEQVFVFRHLFALLLIILFTYNYELMRERYKKAMEGEQLKLQEEKEKLASAKSEVDLVNCRLNDEMIVRKQAEEDLRASRNRLEELVAERTLELQKTNKRLATSESKYRIMADNVNDMIWTADMNLRFTFVSPSVKKIFGYSVEEAMALSLEQWNTPESFNLVFRIYTEQLELEKRGGADPDRSVRVQLDHLCKDGSSVPVEVVVSFLRNAAGEPVGIVGSSRDISERVKAQEENRRIQEQLAQAQKMEAIGTLVGGIAHDFNNILGGIIGSFEVLAMLLKDEHLGKEEKIAKYLKLGMASSMRSTELIKQLLTLSRKHKISLSPVDINDSLKHVVEICKNSLPKTVKIDFLPAGEPMIIMGDMVQMEQVLLNLCINGSHAMTVMRPFGSKQGGVLKIRLSEIQSEDVMKELHAESSGNEGSWVKIEVSDTGIGMDHETVKRIFEPFFSLKRQEEGSGLGLAISYNIIRQHGGVIDVNSEPGSGSSFTVYIPAFHPVEGMELTNNGSDKIVRGSGTILVIDDEPVMLNIARGFLEECGYDVLTADTGNEGITIYREKAENIAAVLVDLSMPGKSGFEVYRELCDINQEVRVILASGMLDADSQLAAQRMGIKAAIQKPYLAHELSAVIKTAIG